jgi:hypothetical protein
MLGNLHQALYLAKHDPVAVAGILLIGGSAVLVYSRSAEDGQSWIQNVRSGSVLLLGHSDAVS